jgi:hypothetical protein
VSPSPDEHRRGQDTKFGVVVVTLTERCTYGLEGHVTSWLSWMHLGTHG